MNEKFRLKLTPVDEAKLEEEKEARLCAYRREYWQGYKKRKKRVYGTLSPEEYAEIKALADSNGRSVWQELRQQARAYRQKQYLPSEEVREEIGRLYAEFRKIGNNLNQIARYQNTYRRGVHGQTVLSQLQSLESVVARFVSRPWTKS
jgi:hypothetical protein